MVNCSTPASLLAVSFGCGCESKICTNLSSLIIAGPLSHIHQIAAPTQSNNTSSQTASTATSQGSSHPGPNGTTMTVKQQARSKRLSTTNDFTFDLDISQGSNINTADLSSILHNNTIMTQNLNLLANYNANEVNNVSFVGIPTPQLSSGANNSKKRIRSRIRLCTNIFV